MLIVPAMSTTEPIRRRCPNHGGNFFSNIPGEAMRPDKPIWVGGFWGIFAEVPVPAQVPPPIPPGQNVCIQTTLQNMMMVSDAPPTPLTGGIVLKSTTGAMIVVNDSGIYIQNGKGASIMMVGPAVNINMGALTIV